eukprot:13760149-Alexandrium_andersonii.AAC.1
MEGAERPPEKGMLYNSRNTQPIHMATDPRIIHNAAILMGRDTWMVTLPISQSELGAQNTARGVEVPARPKGQAALPDAPIRRKSETPIPR